MSAICPVCDRTFSSDFRLCPYDGTDLVRVAPSGCAPGERVADRFVVRESLGEGGFGDVYLAFDERRSEDIALKVLKAGHDDDPEKVRRFLRESRVASTLDHPHVRRVYEAGQTGDGRLYQAMRYVDGEPLSRLLQRSGRLPLARALALAEQLAAALHAAHEAGVVHRDVKPANVLLEAGHEGHDHARLVDFGSARAVDLPPGDQATRTGVTHGTPAYMSPEAILGSGVDARADLYGLGVTLFELLTGVRPFAGDTPMAVMLKHLHDAAPTLAQACPGLRVPAALEALLAELLAKHPDGRPGSAQELRARLARLARALEGGAEAPPARTPPALTETLDAHWAPPPATPLPDAPRPALSLGAALDTIEAQAPSSPRPSRVADSRGAPRPRGVAGPSYELAHDPTQGPVDDVAPEVRRLIASRLTTLAEVDRAEARARRRHESRYQSPGLVVTLIALAALVGLHPGIEARLARSDRAKAIEQAIVDVRERLDPTLPLWIERIRDRVRD